MIKKYNKMIVATGNSGKLNEYRQMLSDMEFYTAGELGLCTDFDETGVSFSENAVIKVQAIGAQPDALVIADDSGLVIDALNGEPGIYSARYMGEDTSYAVKNAALLKRMDGVDEALRTARFVCAIAAMFPDGSIQTVEGVMEGRIAYAPAGGNGFGYDPIFYLPEFGVTSSQLAPLQKNAVSHRGKAIEALKRLLKDA